MCKQAASSRQDTHVTPMSAVILQVIELWPEEAEAEQQLWWRGWGPAAHLCNTWNTGVHTCAHTHVHTHMHGHACTDTQVQTHICRHACAHACADMHAQTHVLIHMYRAVFTAWSALFIWIQEKGEGLCISHCAQKGSYTDPEPRGVSSVCVSLLLYCVYVC